MGYNRTTQELFVDRTRSGDSGFHPQFAGRHVGPLTPQNRRVVIHMFLDTSSLEVLGGHGETVLTERIFPRPESQGLSVFCP